jgi:hypothetical protein
VVFSPSRGGARRRARPRIVFRQTRPQIPRNR